MSQKIEITTEMVIEKLQLELRVFTEISEQILAERFETAKHEDKWNDDLFKRFKISNSRVEVLLELLS